MNVVRKDVDSVNLTLTVQIEKNDYQDRVAKSLKDIRKKAELPGFRAGMAPASFIQKKYGYFLQIARQKLFVKGRWTSTV